MGYGAPPRLRLAAVRRETGGACPELDCVRHLLPRHSLVWAELRAERLDTGADRALLGAGLLGDEAYILALAADLGIAFEPLDTLPRSRCRLAGAEMIEAAATGLLPITDETGAGAAMVVAPRGTGARGLIGLIRNDPALAARFRLTTAGRLNDFLVRAGGDAFSRHASDSLGRT